MKLAELLKDAGAVEIHAAPELEISDVAYDSRAVTQGAAFVAIRGFESDGHRYIPQAVRNGAACVICEEAPQDGVPYVIHHAYPGQRQYEQAILDGQDDVIGHYRVS